MNAKSLNLKAGSSDLQIHSASHHSPEALTDFNQACHPSNFQILVIECDEDENLRRVLLAAKAPLYNGLARQMHCRGIGTCGTCAIEVTGPVSEMTTIEKWRLSFPPHKTDSGLRLACQCRVLGDIEIKKLAGLWGTEPAEAD